MISYTKKQNNYKGEWVFDMKNLMYFIIYTMKKKKK